MINNSEVQEFFTGLASSSNNLEHLARICREYRNTKNSEIKVLSTCLIEVFNEIKQYLDYFESELERKFGFSQASEWKRVQETVISELIEGLTDAKKSETSQGRLELISTFISKWDSFPREDEKFVS